MKYVLLAVLVVLAGLITWQVISVRKFKNRHKHNRDRDSSGEKA